MEDVSSSSNSDLSFLLPDLSAFDGSSVAKGDIKPCPPTPKRIRRTASSAELDEPLTLLSFSAEDEKNRASSFEWETTIGVGALNEGWSVTAKDSGKKFAVLKSKQKVASLSERRVILNAFKNLERLQSKGAWHPHILRHYSLWQEDGHLFLHSELCEKGDLGRLFDAKSKCGSLAESDIWQVIRQILPTLHYMHSCGVLHMDIKPANIYVTAEDVMKLGDFGMSVSRENWKIESDMHEGDANYLAVEVLRDHSLSPAADLFSFGMTLHRLVTGYCIPTSSLSDKSSFLKHPRFPISDHLSQVILSLINPSVEERAKSEHLLSILGLSSLIIAPPSIPLFHRPPPRSSSSAPPTPTLTPSILSTAPVVEMQISDDSPPTPSLFSLSSSSYSSASSSSSFSSSSMSISKTPPSCLRRIVLSPRTPTERIKRKRHLSYRRRSSLRDL